MCMSVAMTWSPCLAAGCPTAASFLSGCLPTPPPGPLPEAERGSRPCLPPLRFGEGAGGRGFPDGQSVDVDHRLALDVDRLPLHVECSRRLHVHRAGGLQRDR